MDPTDEGAARGDLVRAAASPGLTFDPTRVSPTKTCLVPTLRSRPSPELVEIRGLALAPRLIDTWVVMAGFPAATADWVQTVSEQGFALLPIRVPTALLSLLEERPAAVHREGRRGGQRNLLSDAPGVQPLAQLPALREAVGNVLHAEPFAVRAILFDKTPEANWKVPWHQDLTIAVEQRHERLGFGPWSKKEGVIHTHAPSSLLGRMLNVRIHLDDCGEDNGPLKVLPGTHRHGRLTEDAIEQYKATIAPVTCIAQRGEVLAFHPLLLHASSPATRPGHRRVLQLEFAAETLPAPLQWRWRV